MKHGELTQGAPIGGMAAVMMYQPGDAYGRSRYNPVAMRAVVIDKLRERLLGLMFVPDESTPRTGRLRSTMFSPVASRGGSMTPTARAGSPVRNRPTWQQETGRCGYRWRSCRRCWTRRARPRTRMAERSRPLQVGSSMRSERCWQSRGLLNAAGKITPKRDSQRTHLNTPEKFLSQATLGCHLQRAERRGHHRAHSACVLHGGKLRLPDSERKLRCRH